MPSQYSFMLLAFCLTMTAALRPFLTLYAVCTIACFQIINGFTLPEYLSFLTTPAGMIILGIFVLLEIISDKYYSAFLTVISSVRPLAAMLAPLAVMRFPTPAANAMTAFVMGIAVGMPFMRLFTSIIVPRSVQKADLKTGDRRKRKEYASRISNTVTVSFIQDIACAVLAFLSFFSANIILIVQIAAVFALIFLQQKRQNKVEVTPPQVHVSKNAQANTKLPRFPAHTLSNGAKTGPSVSEIIANAARGQQENENGSGTAPSVSETIANAAREQQENDNEENGYGYLS